MKIKVTYLTILCAAVSLFAAACEDIKLPKLMQYDIAAEFFITPPLVIEPKELFTTINTNYKDGQPFVLPVNPNGLTLSGAKRDDGTYVIKLRGSIESGIPQALKLYNHPNPLYTPPVAAGQASTTPAESPFYRYGDFRVWTYPQRAYILPDDMQIVDPNLSPRDIDLNDQTNELIQEKSTRFAAITLKGMLEVKDKKGNVRDLSHGIEIEQRNEALNLYSTQSLTGGNNDWSYSINRYADPPVMSSMYTRLNPEDFPEKDTGSGKNLHRGGISFLIWEGAAKKTVYFTVKYVDGGTTRVEVDYSEVVFLDVQPIVFWFYSDYSSHLVAGSEKPLPIYLSALLSSEELDSAGRPKDPDGSLVTTRNLTAPVYDPPTTGTPPYGPYPYYIGMREKLSTAKAAGNSTGSEMYTNSGDPLTLTNKTITLLPVFFPVNTTNKKITWALGPSSLDALYTPSYNTDGSLTITRTSETGAGTVAVTATVFIPNETATNRIVMKLNAEIVIQ